MSRGNRRWLQDQIEAFMAQYLQVPQLIPALMGAYVNGLKTIQVRERPDYIWVRVRGSDSDILQVFNDKVQRHWDLPVLIYRDWADHGIWKVYGRDINVYEDWGGETYLINHGRQHSFAGGGEAGSDIVWVYKRQVVPLLARPLATATMSVYVMPDYYYFDEQYKFWPGSGTSDLSSYKPTGSLNGKFLTVWLRGTDGSLQIVEGEEFSMLSATEDPTSYISSPPANQGFPIAAVLLQSGTTRIGWGELYDLRQFVSQPPPTGTTIDIYDDSVFVTAAKEIDFVAGLTVNVSGTTAYIDGISELNVYDDSSLVGPVDGIDFTGGLDVSISGSTAYVNAPGSITPPVTGTVVAYDEGSLLGSAKDIDFIGNGVQAHITGTYVWVDIPGDTGAVGSGTTYFRVGVPTPLDGATGTFWRVPDSTYATGSLSVFVNGVNQILDNSYQYQYPGSGTYELLERPGTGSVHSVLYGVDAGGGGSASGAGYGPIVDSVSATATDSHTTDSTWEDIDSMSLSVTLDTTADLLVWFNCVWAPTSANWEHAQFRVIVVGESNGEAYLFAKNANPTNSPNRVMAFHTMFPDLAAGTYTVKAQWHDNNSGQDSNIKTRRLSILAPKGAAL